MRSEQRRILVACLTRQAAIAATPAPPEWQWWKARLHDDDVANGPLYSPSEWFGPLTDAERHRFMRAVYDLDGAGLLVACKSGGGRLQRVKLTEAGISKARELEAAQTATEAADAS